MEPPEIMRELFGLPPLPHINLAEDFAFEIATVWLSALFSENRKQRNTFENTWVSDPTAKLGYAQLYNRDP